MSIGKMDIVIRKHDIFKYVKIMHNGSTIETGLLREEEGKELAKRFREAAEHLEEEYT